MKLILGTAEWNPEGYNGALCPSFKEIRKILALAKEVGINIIDTAEAYNCHNIIKTEATGFCIYTKTRNWKVNLDWGSNELRGILYHYGLDEKKAKLPFVHRWVNLGASVYTRNQLPEETRILQVPFSVNNMTFVDTFVTHRTVFARSIFDRGEAFKAGFSVKDCLKHVQKYRPDGIIVGVKTAKELEGILKEY